MDEWSKKWFQFILDNSDKPWNYYWLSQNTMYIAKEKYIRMRFQDWFRKSALKEELMANVWHPKNWEKFKYLDPETFGEDGDEAV